MTASPRLPWRGAARSSDFGAGERAPRDSGAPVSATRRMSRSSMMVSAARRHAGQAEPRGELALVHHALADEVGVFGDGARSARRSRGRRSARGASPARCDALAPSVKRDRAGRLEQADLGHLLALEALGQRRHRQDVARSRCRGRGAGRNRRSPDRRSRGVVSGWQHDGGDAAGGRGLGSLTRGSRDIRRRARR